MAANIEAEVAKPNAANRAPGLYSIEAKYKPKRQKMHTTECSTKQKTFLKMSDYGTQE